MTAPLVSGVLLVGLGLIGSSLARAIRRHGLAGLVLAHDRDPAVMARGLELGIIDDAAPDLVVALARPDIELIILATPPGTFPALGAALGPHLRADQILTDTGSVKRFCIDALRPHLPHPARLVAGHPIAGTEHSGPDAGFAELFAGRWTILTPLPDADADAVAKVRALWEGMGAMVEDMDPDHHDRVLAITSHLPHLIAYTIVATATDLEEHLQAEVIKFSAGGFRDFTRIAASDPVMWRDVFLHNKDAVLEMVQRLFEDIAILQRAIRLGDGQTLEDLFTRTREIRRGIIAAKQA